MSVERPRSLGHGHITTGVVVVALCVVDGKKSPRESRLLTSKPGHMSTWISNPVKINREGEEKKNPNHRPGCAGKKKTMAACSGCLLYFSPLSEITPHLTPRYQVSVCTSTPKLVPSGQYFWWRRLCAAPASGSGSSRAGCFEDLTLTERDCASQTKIVRHTPFVCVTHTHTHMPLA